MANEDVLAREREVFEAYLQEWREQHLGEFVVIKEDHVVGFFPSLEEAFNAGTRQFGLQPFFVRQIVPRDVIGVSLFGRRLLSA